MSNSEIDTLNQAIRNQWSSKPGDKAKVYIGKFFNRVRIGSKIVAQVVGNHGTYTVSIQATELTTKSACSCYIGKGGYCHHCAALAATFLNNPDSFVEKIAKKLDDVKRLGMRKWWVGLARPTAAAVPFGDAARSQSVGRFLAK